MDDGTSLPHPQLPSLKSNILILLCKNSEVILRNFVLKESFKARRLAVIAIFATRGVCVFRLSEVEVNFRGSPNISCTGKTVELKFSGTFSYTTTRNMSRVLVTGASGFVAMHIVKELVESGKYIVRGTVRSLANEKKVKPLKDLCPENAKYPLELVEADLLKKETWPE